MKNVSIPSAGASTMAVLGSGPSMKQRDADLLHIAGIPCIAVNNTFRMAPWAWMLYAADVEWWALPANADAHRFAGFKVSCQSVRGVHMLRNAGKEGWSDAADCLHTYGNSGAQALQIAAKAGATRVLLLGFDMAGGHWHPEHQAPLRTTLRDTYDVWVSRFPLLAGHLAAKGVDVVNCSPGSALTCFRCSTLDQELATRPELAALQPALQA